MESDEPAGRTGLGALLRRHRLAAGLTQEALAERAGLGTRTVQNLEEGRHRPHRETAERLAAALGLGGDQRAAFEAATRPTPRRPRAAPRAPGKRSGLRAVPTPRHNLPTPLTSFVGRGKEVARVRRLLATARLLTLTGTGGCGKTRLALRSVDGLVAGYPDGIWLVELAALADPALVPATIATVLGLRAQSGR